MTLLSLKLAYLFAMTVSLIPVPFRTARVIWWSTGTAFRPPARGCCCLDLGGVDILMECLDGQYARWRRRAAQGHNVLISGLGGGRCHSGVGANTPAQRRPDRVERVLYHKRLAPLLQLLDSAGVETGHMTTIHYTGKPMVDALRGGLERSRAGHLHGAHLHLAGRLADMVLPELAGRVTARAVRVPTASVSALDLMVTLRKAKAGRNLALAGVRRRRP